MLSFFPRGVLDEILNLIESVFEDFPFYSFKCMIISILLDKGVFVFIVISFFYWIKGSNLYQHTECFYYIKGLSL